VCCVCGCAAEAAEAFALAALSLLILGSLFFCVFVCSIIIICGREVMYALIVRCGLCLPRVCQLLAVSCARLAVVSVCVLCTQLTAYMFCDATPTYTPA